MGEIEAIKNELKLLENKEKAEIIKKYMKSPYFCYGIKVPELRIIAKKYKNLEKYDMLNLFEELWNSGNHEEMSLAIFILQARKNYDLELWNFLMQRIDKIKSWDHADYIATDILSGILVNNIQLIQTIKDMAEDKNFWKRRIAIESTYKLIKKNKLELTFRLAEKLVYDENVYVQKGAGWMLREAGKRDRMALRTFILAHLDMKATAFSYATEKMKELRENRKKFFEEIKNNSSK